MSISTLHIHAGHLDSAETRPEPFEVKSSLNDPDGTPSLELSIGDQAVILFLWGSPQSQWDRLDAIIDASVSLKKRIAAQEALNLLVSTVADAVSETEEPPLCHCGKGYVGHEAVSPRTGVAP